MNELPRTFKLVIIWQVIGTAVFLAVLWFESAQNKSSFSVTDNVIEIKRARDGHYHWSGDINGHQITFLIDTGASMTSIPQSLAEKAQLPVVGRVTFNTANGTTRNSVVRGNLTLEGGVQMDNLRMGVLPDHSGQALLGMDVIGKLHMTQTEGIIRFER